MRNVLRLTLGLSVVAASVALARPASATRWRNFANSDTMHGGPFFMGVAGGCVNTPDGCRLLSGSRIIVWHNTNDGKNHTDQDWSSPFPDTTIVGNVDPTTTPQMGGLSVSGNATQKLANGAQIIVRDVDPMVSQPDQMWQIRRAEDYGATVFAGCFVFRNVNSGQVAGVAGGTVTQGQNVIQWPLYLGTVGSSAGWHPDQFWCPEADITFP